MLPRLKSSGATLPETEQDAANARDILRETEDSDLASRSAHKLAALLAAGSSYVAGSAWSAGILQELGIGPDDRLHRRQEQPLAGTAILLLLEHTAGEGEERGDGNMTHVWL